MITDKMIEAGLQHYSEGGCVGLDTNERREVVRDILEAALSTDQEPVAYLRACKVTTHAKEFESFTLSEKDHPKAFPVYAAPPAPAVAVKALEWQESGKKTYKSETIVGRYLIGSFGRGFVYELLTPDQGDQDDQFGDFNTLEEAKAAAQADYEARILSALSAQVQDVAVPEGWQIVPKVLTPEMSAEINLTGNFTDKAMQARYAVMLSVSPKPEESK